MSNWRANITPMPEDWHVLMTNEQELIILRLQNPPKCFSNFVTILVQSTSIYIATTRFSSHESSDFIYVSSHVHYVNQPFPQGYLVL